MSKYKAGTAPVPRSIGTTVGATALAGGHGGAAPVLGPYKNISAHTVASEGRKGDGRYRRQYEEFAASGAWGYAENTCGRVTLRRQEGAVVTIIPALCGTWACGLCGVRRTAWLRSQIGQAMPAYELRWFWTLTLSTGSCTAVESFQIITHYWDNCRRGLSKKYGQFSYIWTVEPTDQGYAHLHLLCSLQISKHKLHDRWHKATHGSWGADVEEIRSDRAAKYISKYCSKQAMLRREPGWEVLAKKRVFSKSQDVAFEPFRPEKGDGTWQRVSQPYWEAVAELKKSGRVLAERTKGVPVLQVSELEVMQ